MIFKKSVDSQRFRPKPFLQSIQEQEPLLGVEESSDFAKSRFDVATLFFRNMSYDSLAYNLKMVVQLLVHFILLVVDLIFGQLFFRPLKAD